MWADGRVRPVSLLLSTYRSTARGRAVSPSPCKGNKRRGLQGPSDWRSPCPGAPRTGVAESRFYAWIWDSDTGIPPVRPAGARVIPEWFLICIPYWFMKSPASSTREQVLWSSEVPQPSSHYLFGPDGFHKVTSGWRLTSSSKTFTVIFPTRRALLTPINKENVTASGQEDRRPATRT